METQCCFAKAESLIINSVGHRPTDWNAVTLYQALKGRHLAYALTGLELFLIPISMGVAHRYCYKAFSLSMLLFLFLFLASSLQAQTCSSRKLTEISELFPTTCLSIELNFPTNMSWKFM